MLSEDARKFAARAKEQNANAAYLQSGEASNLAVAETFDVGQPKELSFARLQLFKSAAHIGASRKVIFAGCGVIFTGSPGCADLAGEFPAAPTVTQQIRRNLKEITLAFSCVHFRQLGSEETAVALLQQIVGNVTASRNAQKIGPQRTIGPAVKSAEGLSAEARLVSLVCKRTGRRLRELDSGRASVWPNAHGLRAVCRPLRQQPERF